MSIELDFAILAQEARKMPDGKLELFNAAFNDWTWDAFPADLPFFLALRIAVLPGSFDTEHRLAVEIVDNATGTSALIGESPFSAAPHIEDSTRPMYANIIVALGGLTIMRPGAYTFQINVNGRALRAVPFWAR